MIDLEWHIHTLIIYIKGSLFIITFRMPKKLIFILSLILMVIDLLKDPM